MKAKIAVFLFIVLIGVLAVSYDRWHKPDPIGTAGDKTSMPDQTASLPDFSFKTGDGKKHDTSRLPEKGIVLHFWASWCAPCLLEFPALLRRMQETGGDLALIAVSIDNDHDAMIRFIDRLPALKNNPHIYWVWDGDKAISLKMFDTVKVPETILVDDRHRMADKIVGDPGWDGKSSDLRRLTHP